MCEESPWVPLVSLSPELGCKSTASLWLSWGAHTSVLVWRLKLWRATSGRWDFPSKATGSDLLITFKKRDLVYWLNQFYLQWRSRQLFVFLFEFLGPFNFLLLGKHKGGEKFLCLTKPHYKLFMCVFFFLMEFNPLKPWKVTSTELNKPFLTWQLLIQESSEADAK